MTTLDYGASRDAELYEDFLHICHVELAAFNEAVWPCVNPGRPMMHNWHLDAIAFKLQQCAERKIKRLIINMPPRHGKSFCASLAFPAWLLGRDPTTRIISVAYGEDLAGEYARGCKAIMDSSLYKEIFPGTRISAKRSKDDDYQTSERGGRLATTVGGSLTGRGGSVIIIDDPIKAGDVDSEVQRKKNNEWFDHTLISRLDSPMDDVIVLVMQRVHVDDMAGRLIERGGFEVLNLAAIAPTDERIQIAEDKYHLRRSGEALHPERMSLEMLEERRLENPQVFDAQYLQDPSASGDAPFKFNDFIRYLGRMLKEPEDYYVISWDTAAKTGSRNDYSAAAVFLVQYSHMAPGGCTLKKARFHLVEVFRARLNYEGLVEAMLNLQRKYRPKYLLIEDTHMTDAIGSGLRSYGLKEATFVRPSGDKRSRLWAQAHWILQGQVRLPETAPWLPAFQREMEAFPRGAFDDQVDAFSQFLTWISGRIGREVTRQPY